MLIKKLRETALFTFLTSVVISFVIGIIKTSWVGILSEAHVYTLNAVTDCNIVIIQVSGCALIVLVSPLFKES